MDRSWQELLSNQKAVLDQIENKILGSSSLTPASHQVMRALELPVSDVRVLFLGQDPYPTKGVACGLAFAVSSGSSKPQSLKNLMTELKSDIPAALAGGDIQNWVSQGVLLLNAALTTEVGKPAAHQALWREFSSAVIQQLDSKLAGKLVCLSLGEAAKKLALAVSQGGVIQAKHPSPLSASRGFFGSRIYSRVNSELTNRAMTPIDWSC